MEALFISTAAVAVAEIGDKTQLLAFVLAARFRKPWPVVAGIFVATVLNHALAAWVGTLVAAWLTPQVLSWGLGVSFLAMGIWTLIPDKAGEEPEAVTSRFGPFIATAIAFFLVEMGDKTQIATAALGARFQDLFLVASGTTAGMLIADVPAVFLGGAAATRLPMQLVRGSAAAIFIALGAVGILNALGLVQQ